jgi:hypothetical protein
MTSQKNNKGRPKGTEKDDSAVLSAIADMIHATPTLKASTAMRRYKRDASDAEIRRWQAKWKERKQAYLLQAAERAVIKNAPVSSHHAGNLRRNLVQLAAMGVYPDPATMRLAMEGLSPGIKAIMAFQSSPEMRIIRELQNSPVMRIAQGLSTNPIVQLAEARRMGLL